MGPAAKWRIALFFLTLIWASSASGEIIDGHLHLFDAGNPSSATVALTAMDEAGVSQAVILSGAYSLGEGERLSAQTENDAIAALVAARADRFIGFCGVPFTASWALQEIERCATKLKLRGLKLHPQQAGVDLRNSDALARLARLFEAAEKHSLVILIDSMWLDSRVTVEVLRISIQYPRLKIVLAHALVSNFRDLALIASLYETAPGIPRNLYVDLSATVVFYADNPERDLLVWHLRKFGLDRVVFGSDYPVFSPKQTLEALKKYPFDEAELNRIRAENIRDLLKLQNSR